jgi:hypothetical protein
MVLLELNEKLATEKGNVIDISFLPCQNGISLEANARWVFVRRANHHRYDQKISLFKDRYSKNL